MYCRLVKFRKWTNQQRIKIVEDWPTFRRIDFDRNWINDVLCVLYVLDDDPDVCRDAYPDDDPACGPDGVLDGRIDLRGPYLPQMRR